MKEKNYSQSVTLCDIKLNGTLRAKHRGRGLQENISRRHRHFCLLPALIDCNTLLMCLTRLKHFAENYSSAKSRAAFWFNRSQQNIMLSHTIKSPPDYAHRNRRINLSFLFSTIIQASSLPAIFKTASYAHIFRYPNANMLTNPHSNLPAKLAP